MSAPSSELRPPPPALPPRDHRWWVLAAVGVGTFMAALNGSVVNAVTPVLMQKLSIGLAGAEWITLIFLLLVSGLLLTFGRLGDLWGHKRLYLVGCAVFVAGTLLSGLAPGATSLIAARGLQAVGAAMLMANAPALLTRAFPPRQRGQALGLQGTFTYLGLMVGPSLGGLVTHRFGWRAAFLIAVPLGLLAWGLAAAWVPNEPTGERRERFDLAGAALFLAGLSALLLTLSHGQEWGWATARTLGLLAVSAVVLTGFVLFERRAASPMVDLSLFRIRLVNASLVSALCNYVCLYAVVFLMPFYLIRSRGMTPAQTGLLLSSQALVMAILAPLSGALSDRIGSRGPSSVGMAFITVAMLWLSSLSADAGTWAIVGRLALTGAGCGLFASPNTSALMGAAPRERQGVAAALLASGRNVGMVLGVALAGALFARFEGLSAPERFLPAFRVTFLVLSLFGALGTITSLTRGGVRVPSDR